MLSGFVVQTLSHLNLCIISPTFRNRGLFPTYKRTVRDIEVLTPVEGK
jgi:hypothetical protein